MDSIYYNSFDLNNISDIEFMGVYAKSALLILDAIAVLAKIAFNIFDFYENEKKEFKNNAENIPTLTIQNNSYIENVNSDYFNINIENSTIDKLSGLHFGLTKNSGKFADIISIKYPTTITATNSTISTIYVDTHPIILNNTSVSNLEAKNSTLTCNTTTIDSLSLTGCLMEFI